MSNSLKQLMGMSEADLVALGAQHGLVFHAGMKKSQMAQQIQTYAASGWMEENQHLMSGMQESPSEDGMMFDGGESISDAAHVAQMLSSAGFTETFHAAMNGPSHHAEAVNAYLGQLGVSSDEVWMHMPRANPNETARHFGSLNNYMRDTLVSHQDLMPEIHGHYASNFMDEFSTNQGGVQQSYEYLSHMYVDKGQYKSRSQYEHDLGMVSARLQSQLGGRFAEVAFSSAIGSPTSYIDSLPRLGDESVVRGIQHPRQPLNASGLPYGSYGSGINPEYSLSASLSGQPGWSDVAKSLYSDVSDAAKSLAKVYSGETGLSSYKHQTSDRDMILDSASRYADIVDVRHGYNNLKLDIGDEPRYSGNAIRSVLDNANEYNEAEVSATFDPAARIRSTLSSSSESAIAQTGSGFTANFGPATFSNPAFERREAKRIAELDSDSAYYRDVPGANSVGSNPAGPQFNAAFEQGTPEWLAFREQYDITGSTVGSYLGNNRYTNPIKEMSDKLGYRGEVKPNRDMARGHELEPIARQRVSQQFGFDIGEVGAITNPDYPRMMYSPDGLIGDDALWEHKAPRKFFDINDHQDYVDQVQLGMQLSGRNRTLFSQTVGNETRSQWIEQDPDWFEKNQGKLMSTLGRMDAARRFEQENAHLSTDELKAGVRQSLTGDGIWGFQTTKTGNDYYTAGTRGMSRFSATAGTDADPFIEGGRNSFESQKIENEFNDYKPNFTHYTPNYPSVVGADGSQPGTDVMAQSVKQGILAAQEENKQRDAGRSEPDNADDFFDDMIRGSHAYNGGGGRRGGGGGKEPPDRDWFTGGTAGGDLVRGIAGGSINSLSSGVMTALARTPWGMAAAAGIGAVSIGNEVAENVNDFIGQAQDAGMDNPNAYSAMNLGLQQLGLNESQATRINQTTHSAYNTLLNGDPSAAVRIVQGTRGLLTIGDIRSAEGDPVRLAQIAQERGRERGWSQQRVAGAMQMAGLDGLARSNARGEYEFSRAEANVQAGQDSDYREGVASSSVLQANRANLNVAQNALQGAVTYGAPAMQGATNAIIDARAGLNRGVGAAEDVYNFIVSEESGGREFNADGTRVTSPTGARGAWQILPSTARDPGYGLKPSDGSPADDARLAQEYYDKLLDVNNGDSRKAMAAYTDGQGTVDKAVAAHGKDWLTFMPQQAQNRVNKYDEWTQRGYAAQEGAGGFTRNGVSYGQAPVNVNVEVNATVNNKQASAVATVNGQSVSQTINTGNGAMQRR